MFGRWRSLRWIVVVVVVFLSTPTPTGRGSPVLFVATAGWGAIGSVAGSWYTEYENAIAGGATFTAIPAVIKVGLTDSGDSSGSLNVACSAPVLPRLESASESDLQTDQ